jgi:hypothetical protein
MQGRLTVTEGRGYPLTDGRTDIFEFPYLFHVNGKVGASVRLSVCDHWTQRKVTLDAEKSDGKKKSDAGRREKWREKNKTTVGWRAFEVLKPRS